MDEQRAAWVALALVPGIGPTRLHNLIEVCHTPIGALAAPFAFLCHVPGMSEAAAAAVKSTSVDAGRRVLEQMERAGAHVLVPSDAEFPASLLQIPDPPPVLFASGDLSLLRRPAAAVVGSRDHSAYGAEMARWIGWEASAAGVVVVSGMARGLDAVAHSAALDAGGSTIGVLGNGLGVIYPAANRLLYERVAAAGLLLTEFPPGAEALPFHFPQRNRIIAALSNVVLVAQAPERSGALITSEHALDMGIDVLAVPGPPRRAVCVGTNRLLQDGAGVVLEPRDVLDGDRPVPRQRELRSDIEQLVLDARECSADLRRNAGLGEQQPDRAVRLVHVAERDDARIRFVDSLAVREPGRAVVAGARVDPAETVTHCCRPYALPARSDYGVTAIAAPANRFRVPSRAR